MIEKYEILTIDGEKRLFLFLNLNYEFGGRRGRKRSFKKEINNYIKKNKIFFHGGVISFVVGGVLIGNVVFNNGHFKDYKPVDNYNYVGEAIVEKIQAEDNIILENNFQEEIIHLDNKTSEKVIKKDISVINTSVKVADNISSNEIHQEDNYNDSNEVKVEEEDTNYYVNLKTNVGNVEKIELEEYLIGVVGAEMPALFNIEALKAQAIIARTYAVKNTLKGNVLKANESNQTYKTNDELKAMWGSNYNTYYNKVKTAVETTEGTVLKYGGTYIEAVYHSTSNGKTESSVNVWGNYYPYLISVSSEYDNLNVSFEKSIEMPFEEISNKLGFIIDKETKIEIMEKTSGDRIESIIVGENTYRGIDLRNILGLRSADFDFEVTDSGIKFTTRGYGHGVGLSQYGANGMAKNGYNYEAILKHYYQGVYLENINYNN